MSVARSSLWCVPRAGSVSSHGGVGWLHPLLNTHGPAILPTEVGGSGARGAGAPSLPATHAGMTITLTEMRRRVLLISFAFTVVTVALAYVMARTGLTVLGGIG